MDEPDFLHASPDCLLPPEAWANKKERFRCFVCAQKFNHLFRRRNHCRLCGELFCKQCIVNKFLHIAGREKVSVKICTPCAYEDANNAKRQSPLIRSSRRLLQMSEADATKDLMYSPVMNSVTSKDTERSFNSMRHSFNGDLDFEESFYQGRFECPSAPCLIDEMERLNALKALQILYTPPEETFNVICELAATTLHCPMSVVSFMDLERQWFKAKMGISKNYLSRRVSFCAHAISSSSPTVVLDTRADHRFARNPLVTDYGIRFFAAVPLVTSEGWAVGTLAVFDYQAHPTCDASSLIPLARGIMKQLEDRKLTRQVHRRRQASSFDDRTYTPARANRAHLTPTLGPQSASLNEIDNLPLLEHPESAPTSPHHQVNSNESQNVSGSQMETMLVDLLHKTSQTQQELATQQGTMFLTLGHHSEQIGKLAEALARMESKLGSPKGNRSSFDLYNFRLSSDCNLRAENVTEPDFPDDDGINGQVCNNNGNCIDGKCICNQGWTHLNDTLGLCDLEFIALNNSTYLFVLIISCVAGILAYNASLLYLYYVDNALVQKSRPIFVHLMNFGTILCAASIAVGASILAIDEQCSIAWCLADISFVLVFGTVVMRLYRSVCILLSSSNGPAVKLSDTWVLLRIGGLLVIEAGLLTGIWLLHGFDIDQAPLWLYPGNKWVQFQGCFLHSRNAAIALIAPKGFYLIMILAFALKLRKSKTEERDMTKLAFCIGLTMILWAIGLSLYATASKALGEMFYLCLIFLLLLPSTMVVFVTTYPKWIEIHRAHSGHQPAVRPSIKNSQDLNLYLHHIAWNDVQQVEDAERQLQQLITEHPNGLEIGTILMLLSDRVRHRGIRRLSASQLEYIDSSSLSMYLPQLIQALKYDMDAMDNMDTSPFVIQLLRIASQSIELTYQFHWCVVVELQNQISVVIAEQEIAYQDRKTKPLYERLYDSFFNTIQEQTKHSHIIHDQTRLIDYISQLYQRIEKNDSKKMTFQLCEILAQKESTFSALHPLYPAVWICGFDASNSFVFKSNAKPFKLQLIIDTTTQLESIRMDMNNTLLNHTSSWKQQHVRFLVGIRIEMIHGISSLSHLRFGLHGQIQLCQLNRDGFDEKRVIFEVGAAPSLLELEIFDKECIGTMDIDIPHGGLPLTSFHIPSTACQISLVIDVDTIQSVNDPFHQEGFQRAMTERLHGTMESISPSIIFKHGDDLRQDQLALQLLAVMDSICTNHGLHLHFTLYRVLPTSVNEGIAEFVPESFPMSAVLSDNNYDILTFLRRHQFDANTSTQVKPKALDIFIRSVAGYCVATYILGIGDRHLDNLMMKTTGHFFHIDFGFMFGKDPKPMPPPFRLTPEMVQAMGGIDGEGFLQCVNYAKECFNLLRQHAHVLFAVLHLTKDAGIPDMCSNMNQENDVAIYEVEKRLILRASTEKAGNFIQQLMIDSQNTKTTARLSLMERLHRVAVALK